MFFVCLFISWSIPVLLHCMSYANAINLYETRLNINEDNQLQIQVLL